MEVFKKLKIYDNINLETIKKSLQFGEIFLKLLFNKINDLSKNLRVSDCHIWKNFTIQHNTLSVHRMNKSRVIHTIETSRVIKTHCPKLTKLSLLEFTRDIWILTCLHDGILCTRINIPVHSTKTLCKSKDIFMSFVCHHTTFYTSHKREIRYWIIRGGLSSVWEREASFELVSYMENTTVSISTFCFIALVFKKMFLSCFINDVLTSSCDFNTFFCTRVSLEFHKR